MPSSAVIHPVQLEDEVTMSAWTTIVLFGPLVPTLFAMVIIIFGNFILLAEEDCNPTSLSTINQGCTFLGGAVTSSYLLILIFMWVFMGTRFTITIAGKSFTIAKPFSRLRTVVACYSLTFALSLGVFGLGTQYIMSPTSSPDDDDEVVVEEAVHLVFAFSLVVVLIYWTMVLVLGVTVVKTGIQSRKDNAIINKTAAAAQQAAMEADLEIGGKPWFQAMFNRVSSDPSVIEPDKLGAFFEVLGIDPPMSSGEISTVVELLDVEGLGDIQFDGVWEWFNGTGKNRVPAIMAANKKRAKGNKEGGADDEDDDSD
jgi:hypothetical protein